MDTNGFQHPEHAHAGDIAGQLGLLERKTHETDGTQVVDLVRLRRFQHSDQAGQVTKVSLEELN